MIMIATSEPVLLTELRPDVPLQLAAVVHRAIARDPNERHQSAFDLSEALAPWCDERSHAVIDAARRRAARVSGLPVPATTVPAASVRPPSKPEVIAPRQQSSHAGLSKTALPSPPARAASRTLYIVAALILSVAAVVGVFALRGPSLDVSASREDPSGSPPGSDQSPNATAPSAVSASVAVVDSAREAPEASVSASASGLPPAQPVPRHAAPRSRTRGPPRLGDITIKR